MLGLPVDSNGASYDVILGHAANSFTAWWIAFGPHGPRATDPPGEWTRVWIYTAAGVAISAAVFWGIHAMARPEPRNMTKRWQEATNEYLKVSRSLPLAIALSVGSLVCGASLTTLVHSPKNPILCT